jgi:hypothetical protein
MSKPVSNGHSVAYPVKPVECNLSAKKKKQRAPPPPPPPADSGSESDGAAGINEPMQAAPKSSAASSALPIESHMQGSRKDHGRQLRRLLSVTTTTLETQIREVHVETTFTLDDLIKNPNAVAMRIGEAAAKMFQKQSFDKESGTEVRSGDIENVQIPSVRLLEYRNELPISVGIEIPNLAGNIAPLTVSGNNGRAVPYILRAENHVDFTLTRQHDGILLHDNRKIINADLFATYSGVTESKLREGVRPSADHPDCYVVNMKVNQLLRGLIVDNVDSLERNFRAFSFNDLVHQVNHGRIDGVILPKVVVEEMVNYGLQMGINPVKEGTVALRSVLFALTSLTSESGKFEDLTRMLEKKYGADQVEMMLNKAYTVSMILEIEAIVAGVVQGDMGGAGSESESEIDAGQRTRFVDNGDAF